MTGLFGKKMGFNEFQKSKKPWFMITRVPITMVVITTVEEGNESQKQYVHVFPYYDHRKLLTSIGDSFFPAS